MPTHEDTERDRQILMADALRQRIREFSLSDFVECLTAFALCFRRAVVEGKAPEAFLHKIAVELVGGLDKDLPEKLVGDDINERRKEYNRVSACIGAMRPGEVADLMDEMAEGYREVLLYESSERLERFHRALDGDIALAASPAVREAVRLDRLGAVVYREVTDSEVAALVCPAPA